MKELIAIQDNGGNQVVSARELHQFLKVKTPFVKWIDRMLEYGFTENQDYTVTDFFVPNSKGGRQKQFDCALILDCAKEISMIQRNEKGKQARQYFIEVEKKAKEQTKPLTQMEVLLQSVHMLAEQDKRLHQVEDRVLQIEAKTTTRPDYFTIVGFAVLNGIEINLSLASALGRKAAAVCKQRNLLTDTIPDARFGRVRMYPKHVLQEVFDNHKMSA